MGQKSFFTQYFQLFDQILVHENDFNPEYL